MVRVTEKEITDIDGRIIKVREIESAYARIEKPDGTVEEYSDINAAEWPWSPPENTPEWRVFGIPMPKVFEIGRPLADSTLTLLYENGEAILKIGSLSVGMQLAADRSGFLMGNEVPLD